MCLVHCLVWSDIIELWVQRGITTRPRSTEVAVPEAVKLSAKLRCNGASSFHDVVGLTSTEGYYFGFAAAPQALGEPPLGSLANDVWCRAPLWVSM